MIDYRLVRILEKHGYVNRCGKRVCGTAAVLHFLHCPFSSISQDATERGKAYVEKLLRA